MELHDRDSGGEISSIDLPCITVMSSEERLRSLDDEQQKRELVSLFCCRRNCNPMPIGGSDALTEGGERNRK